MGVVVEVIVRMAPAAALNSASSLSLKSMAIRQVGERYEVIRQSSAGLLTTKPHIERLLTDGYKTSNSTRLCILRRAFYMGPS